MIEIKNAIIKDADLDIEQGFLTAWIMLDYGTVSQGFGGFNLYPPVRYNYAGLFIHRILEIVGVDKWSKLRGKTIRAKTDCGKVHAIGHIIKDDWFDPEQEFKTLEEN